MKQADIDKFNADGYVIIRNFWPMEALWYWEESVRQFYEMQLTKIAGKRNIPYQHRLNIDQIVTELEALDKEAAYQVIKMLPTSPAAMHLASYFGLTNAASELLNVPTMLLTTNGPVPFINMPKSKRLLYRWHSESTYYPKRRNFLNVWFPMFRAKDSFNGTMWFCKGSHTRDNSQFAEYQGYDSETFDKRQHFIQYEIPEAELREYEKICVTALPGDVVLFHRNMVHASSPNEAPLPSYATVLRMLDYRGDLTLSGEAAVYPYVGRDYARPAMHFNEAVN